MSTTALIGKSKELYVATLLVSRHLHVYMPVVDNGFDLMVTTRDGKLHLPVQVKYKATRTGLTLSQKDAKKFVDAGAVLAFGEGDAQIENFYFLHAADWQEKAGAPRENDTRSVYLKDRDIAHWASKFKGTAGLERAFKKIIDHNERFPAPKK